MAKLPDYKPSFPSWKENILDSLLTNVDVKGIDLLEVSAIILHAFHSQRSDESLVAWYTAVCHALVLNNVSVALKTPMSAPFQQDLNGL